MTAKAKGAAPTTGLKVLSSGIDWLYVSFRCEVRAELLDDLEVVPGIAPATSYEPFVAVHHDSRQFTGFTFGRDAMVARLYDKGAEIAHSGKSWMRAIWGTDWIRVSRCGALSFSFAARSCRTATSANRKRSCGGARTCGATRRGGCRCDRQGLECGEQGGRLPAHGCTFHAWSSGLRRARWCGTASKNTISLCSSVALPATRARWEPSRV